MGASYLSATSQQVGSDFCMAIPLQFLFTSLKIINSSYYTDQYTNCQIPNQPIHAKSLYSRKWSNVQVACYKLFCKQILHQRMHFTLGR